jgi:hypothetical protein
VATILDCSYLVPVRWPDGDQRQGMTEYLAELAALGPEIVVVDGSPPAVFGANAEAWGRHVAVHVPPDPAEACLNGKVAGVRTAVALATRESLVIADDDVRYEHDTLRRLVALLGEFDLVRPQNYFDPLPWHARWDSARTLLNRSFGVDYPGTLGVRRSRFLAMGGYDGDVLFENLELIRTVRAHGGRTCSALDLYVRRLPPSSAHFRGQRVRQAYDDFALPVRMAAELTLVPAVGLSMRHRRPDLLAITAAALVLAAERGRRRAGGERFFPVSASLLAPVWVAERGVCAWLALLRRGRGGVRYAGSTIKVAAHSETALRRRLEPYRSRSMPTAARALAGATGCSRKRRAPFSPLRHG